MTVSRKSKEDDLSGEIEKIRNAAGRVLDQANGMQKAAASIILSSDDKQALKQNLDDLAIASRHLQSLTNKSNRPETYCSFDIQEGIRVQIQGQAIEKKIALKFAIDREIPAVLQGTPLYKIHNVLNNFVSNAIRFSKNGSTIEIGMELVSANGSDIKVRFSVKDTGEGMTKEQCEELFSSSRKSGEAVQVGDKDKGGTGFGIGSCIEEVRKMNPYDSKIPIGVESEKGKGSKFWFEAPFEIVPDLSHSSISLSSSTVSTPIASSSSSLSASPLSNYSSISFQSEPYTNMEIHDIKNAVSGLIGQVSPLQETVSRISSEARMVLSNDLTTLSDASKYLFYLTKLSLGGNNQDTYNPEEIHNFVKSLADPDSKKHKIAVRFEQDKEITGSLKGPNPYWIGKVLLCLVSHAVSNCDGISVKVAMAKMGQMGSDIKVRFSVKGAFNASVPEDMLVFCAGEVEKMNPGDSSSHIGLDVEKEKDSVLWFEVPLTIVSAPKDPKSFFASLRVLAVDDNIVNLRVLTRICVGLLKIPESNTCFVQSGKAALEKFKDPKQQYDVILMDVHMPEMDGNEAAKQIREFEKANKKTRIPIIACAGLDGDDKLSPDIDALLAKPIGKDSLRAALLERVSKP